MRKSIGIGVEFAWVEYYLQIELLQYFSLTH